MEIIEVTNNKTIDDFIKIPLDFYSGDPFYVPQLKSELKTQFSAKNPFFGHADVKFFIARKNGSYAGRIVSIINRRHMEFHNEKAGFFGFFESRNDPEVSCALLDTVSGELKDRGMEMMRGPMNFSTNEECGFLMDGFDSPPLLMMPYNPPFYNDLMVSYGMEKSKDLYAYIYKVQEKLPEKVLRVAALAEKRGITARPVVKKNFNPEMQAFKEVYNSAWAKNWGFIPLTDEELNELGARLKQIIVPDMTLIAEDNGKPVGFLGLLPDFNYVLKFMNGSMNPVSILKALYYSRKIKDLRLLLFGIKPEYRNRGVDAVLLRETFKGILKGKYKRVEFSWILEDNINVQRIIEMVGGTLYKRYRIYEKMLL